MSKVSTKSKVEMEDEEEVSSESRVNIDKSYFSKWILGITLYAKRK